MPTPYTKPHLPLTDQLALLKQRGLQVANDADAIECLQRNGYYRLSAYWYPFREIAAGVRTDNFLPNSRFEDARALYVFDKKLKLLLLDAIERVEIAARSNIALYLGAYDPFAHTDPRYFRPSFINPHPSNPSGPTEHQVWLEKFDTAVSRSRDEFILHYERKYGNRDPLPLWIAIELWDFGLLSRFYSGMDTPHCVAVANKLSVPRWHLMKSWLRSLNYVRNVIAHHGRLWNINLVESPRLPNKGVMAPFDVLDSLPDVHTRIYSICCILSYLSKVVDAQSSWPSQLTKLVKDFPVMPHARLQSMGFPRDWESHDFWR